MRPRKWYAVFDMGKVIAVVEGLAAAQAYGTKSYRAFKSRLAAEEYACWHNY